MPLTLLYQPNSPGSAEIDIIAVHGLNLRDRDSTAHAWDTWRTPPGPEGRLWLPDDFPGLFSAARIDLYEYDAAAVYGRLQATFNDNANSLLEAIRMERVQTSKSRPVIFLGHSMGGLLIKQALVNGTNNSRYKAMKDATYGICFFATPHRGWDNSLMSLGQAVTTIAVRLGFRNGDNVLEVLRYGSPFSEILRDHWRNHSGDYHYISF